MLAVIVLVGVAIAAHVAIYIRHSTAAGGATVWQAGVEVSLKLVVGIGSATLKTANKVYLCAGQV